MVDDVVRGEEDEAMMRRGYEMCEVVECAMRGRKGERHDTTRHDTNNRVKTRAVTLLMMSAARGL